MYDLQIAALLPGRKRLEHRSVQRCRSLASTHHRQGHPCLLQAEIFPSLPAAALTNGHEKRVASNHSLLFPTPTTVKGMGEGNGQYPRPWGQQAVGKTGDDVLLVDHQGHAEAERRCCSRNACVSAEGSRHPGRIGSHLTPAGAECPEQACKRLEVRQIEAAAETAYLEGDNPFLLQEGAGGRLATQVKRDLDAFMRYEFLRQCEQGM
jgi:hypothetical protein